MQEMKGHGGVPRNTSPGFGLGLYEVERGLEVAEVTQLHMDLVQERQNSMEQDCDSVGSRS